VPTAQRSQPLADRRVTRRGCLAAAVALAVPACDGPPPAAPSVPGPAPGHRVSGTLGVRRPSRFELLSAASSVTVRAAAPPGELYRVTTPAGSGLAPLVRTVPGLVRAALRPTGGHGPQTVEVLLHAAVRWALVLRAGAGEIHLDLAAAVLGGIALRGGTGLLRLFLPRPAAPVVVRLGGGIGRAEIHAPAGVPVVVRGAARAVRPGLPGPGYVVDARAPVGALVLR
jgi:hypothetical protein